MAVKCYRNLPCFPAGQTEVGQLHPHPAPSPIDEEIGRLDVSVGQAGVPHATHHKQGIFDDLRSNFGFPHLPAAFDELGDDVQVVAQTLRQWMLDNPSPDMETVRNIIEEPFIIHGVGDRAERTKWVDSLLEIYDRGGWLPKGPTGIEYSSIMVASHEIALIVSAYQKGIRNYDVDHAWRAIKHIQTTPGGEHEGGGQVGNENYEAYLKLGTAFARLNKAKEACTVFKTMKAKHPNAPTPVLQRADLEMSRISCK